MFSVHVTAACMPHHCSMHGTSLQCIYSIIRLCNIRINYGAIRSSLNPAFHACPVLYMALMNHTYRKARNFRGLQIFVVFAVAI